MKNFENLRYSNPVGWHPAYPDYKLLFYNSIQVSQVIGALQVIHENFLSQFDTIVEIGTYNGGLSSWVYDLKKPEAKFVSYDIDPVINNSNRIDIDFRIGDCFEEKTKNEIIELIKTEGSSLLLCDGGDKNREFNVFTEHMKDGDHIMLHDFLVTEEQFSSLQQYWQWPYGNESDLPSVTDTIAKFNLKKDEKYDDFLSTFWGCYIK